MSRPSFWRCLTYPWKVLRAPAGMETLFCALLLAPFLLQQAEPPKPGQGLMLSVYRGKELDPDHYLATFWSSEPKISLRENIFPENVSKIGVSMRWEGFLDVAQSGQYRIGVRVDDGVRILIDTIFLIDDWSDQPEHQKFATINLQEGLHQLTIDYRQASGDAVLELFWMKPGAIESTRIPQSVFRLVDHHEG